MRIQITLRSGAQIEADVDEFTIGKSQVSDQIRELHWVSPAGSMRRLKHVALSEIAAIIAIHEPGDDGTCACEQLEVGLPGSGETIRGRRNPKCPMHTGEPSELETTP